jgi:hypothetical protein
MLAVAIAAGINAQSKVDVPRTPDGHPDFQGTWDNWTAAPLERPKELSDKTHFSEEEAAEYLAHDIDRFRAARGEVEFKTNGEIDGVWSGPARLGPSYRTSIVVDPADGRLPPLTVEGQQRTAARVAARKEHPFDNPEDLTLGERCLLWGAGPPLLPVPQNNYLQIVQTHDAVLVLTEMIHDARIVPLDGHPHLPLRIRQWKGDSRGRWEGDTLVIDTTNFSTTPSRHVIERFELVDADSIRYRFTVEDPASFTAPWSGELYLLRSTERLFEYACHEANYSMELVLRGARAEEKR